MAHIDDPRVADLLKRKGQKLLTMPSPIVLFNAWRGRAVVTFAVDGFSDPFRARVLGMHVLGERSIDPDADVERGSDMLRLMICDTGQIVLACVMWHGQGQISGWIMAEASVAADLAKEEANA